MCSINPKYESHFLVKGASVDVIFEAELSLNSDGRLRWIAREEGDEFALSVYTVFGTREEFDSLVSVKIEGWLGSMNSLECKRMEEEYVDKVKKIGG